MPFFLFKITKGNTVNFLEIQLGNHEQMQLELKELRQQKAQLLLDLNEKNETIGRVELKERELILITTEKLKNNCKKITN